MKNKNKREYITHITEAAEPLDLSIFCNLVAKAIISKNLTTKEIDTNGKVYTVNQMHCKGDL